MTKIISALAIAFLIGCGQHISAPSNAVSFEKIIFHTSVCFGTCPVYHLEVKADKSLKLFAEHVYFENQGKSFVDDTTKTGYFTGMVEDTTFAKIGQELKTIRLDSLEFDGATCCDGSLKTIIVYYDGKRKFLRSMFPPDKANRLIDILYEICKTSKLQRTEEKFEIENEKASG